MTEFQKEIKAARAQFMLSTACSCHGVMDAFQLSAR